MPDALPSCFRAGARPESTAAGSTLSTSVYDTPLGVAALSWSRTLLGLSLLIDLRLHDAEPLRLRLRLRPWLLWCRRGRRRIRLPDGRQLLLSWDFSRAVFPLSGGLEPLKSFSLSLSLDSQPILFLGDVARQSPISPLISRCEHVTISGSKPYTTTARFADEDRQISIQIGGKEKDRDAGMILRIDGDKILHVKRIRWKFRGSERTDLAGGERVRVSWDLHRWFFPDAGELGRAVFLIRFESDDEEGCSAKSWNWSESSSESNKKMKKSLLKTSSSSSASSASSSVASSSSVMEWASPEEDKLRGARGFSLLVYASRS